MKKFFALVITLMVMTFCVQAQTLLSESFDSGTLPTGWTIIDNDGDGYNWDANYFASEYAHSGNGMIASASYINYVGALNPNNWLISPQITIPSSGFALTWYAAIMGYPEPLEVLISTTGNTIADFQTSLFNQTISADVSGSGYGTFSVDLSSYTGQSIYIAFVHRNSTDNYWLLLDDVTVFATPTTPTIDVSPLSVDLGTTILGDTASGTISVVGYSLTGSITATATAPFLISADGVTFGSTATLPQDGGTLYVAYVPSMAGEETGTVTLTSTGATSVTVDLTGTGLDCSNIQLPITQSFESLEDLNCWTPTSMNTENLIGLATNDASVGSKTLYFSSNNSATSGNYNQYLFTPILPNTVNKMVTFDYEAYSPYSESFKVGYSTADTISISDFTWGPTITVPSNTSTGAWQTYINAAIPAEARYIAINFCPSTSHYYLFVDNLSIVEATDCMAPVSVNVSNITQNAASINWTPIGSEEAWSVVVVEEGEDPDQGTPEVATDHPFVVSGLMPATEYDVYVRANCESENSPWSTAATFTTTPDCSNPSNPVVTGVTGTSAVISWNAAPYGVTSYVVEYGIAESGSTLQVTVDSATSVVLTGLEPQSDYEFSITSVCSSQTITPVPVTGTFSTGCLVTVDVSIGNGTSTNNYLPSYSFYNYSYTQQIFQASEFNGPSDFHSLAFEMTAVTSQRNFQIYLLHTSATDASSWIPADSATLVYSGPQQMVVGWNTYNFNTAFHYNGTDNLALIILDMTGSYSSGNYARVHTGATNCSKYIYQDGSPYSITSLPSSGSSSTLSQRMNVKFGECDETSTCASPVLTNYVYGSTEATLTWVPGYQETDWTIEYKAASDTAWTSEGSVTSPHTILNLSPDTYYDVRLYADCGGELSSPVSVNFTTDCAVIIPPYLETFTGWNTNPSACWSRYTGLASSVFAGGALTSTTSGWNFSSSNVFPVGHPKVNVYSTGCRYWLVTPPIDLSTMIDPELTFDLAFTDYASTNPIEDPSGQPDDQFMVIVSTDNGATWNQANATVWNNQGAARVLNNISNQGEEVSVSLSQYIGQTIKIAFYSESTVSNGDNDLHIANVRVNEKPTCPKPQILVADSVTADEIYFSWTPDGEETSWQYLCVPQGTVVDVETAQWEFAYDTFAVASTLNANSAYTLYVRAYCDESDQSEPKTLNVRTDCGATNIPFYEGFESYSTGYSAPMYCWTRHNDYSSGYNYPYISTSSAATGSNSLYFYAGSGQYNLIATPQFESSLALNTVQVSFQMNAYSVASYLVVGVMTDPTDINTFTAVDTARVTAASTYQFVEIPLSSYTGTGSYIAIKYTPSSYTSVYIDDFIVEAIPSCPRPTSLVASSTPSDTVFLNWTDATGDLWDIIYGPAGFDPDTSVSATLVSGLSTTSYAVSGLSAGVVYDFYVRTDCGGGEVSSWSFSPAQATPYTITMSATGTETVTACGGTIYDAGGSTGNYPVNCNGTLTVMPEQGMLVQVQGTYNTESGFDFLYIYDGIGTSGALLWSGSGSGTIALIESTTGPLTLVFTSDVSVTYSGFALTVSCTEAPSCMKPTNVTVNSGTTTTVDISWIEIGTATTWNIEYGPAGFTQGQGTLVSTTTNPYTLTGLTAATNYDIYVQSDCGGGDESEWTPVATVATLPCDDACVYTFNMTDSYGDGWNDAYITVTTSLGTQSVTLSDGLTGSQNVLLCPGDSMLLSWNMGMYDSECSFTVEDASGTVLYTCTSASSLGSGTFFSTSCGDVPPTPPTCSVPTNVTASSVTYNSASINWTAGGNETAWNLQYKKATDAAWSSSIAVTSRPYTLSNLDAETAYNVRVQANCGADGTSDWSTVANFTTAAAPANPCDDPTGLTVGNITAHTAVATWTAGGDETSWNIQYKLSSESAWNSYTSSTPSYTLEGLTPESNYTVQVQAKCSETNLSNWVSTTFTTLVDGISSVELANSISIMPNPAESYIELSINSNVNVKEASIYNAFGQMIQNVMLTDNHARIDVSNMAAGMYFVRIANDNSMATKKFIKK